MTFTILIVISLLLMAFSNNALLRDVQNGIGFAFRPITGSIDDVAQGVASIGTALVEIDRLRVDNGSLRTENERLTTENARLLEIQRENEQLTALLQLRAGFQYQTAAASVIMRESSEFRRVVGIDKGTNAGIKVGDVVMGSGGSLAGRVTSVGPDSALVVLLSDPSSTVIGQLMSSAGKGEVVGQLGGTLVMQQIDASDAVTLGDEVVTAGVELGSGIRSPYPKGLLIGQVIDSRRNANDVVQTAYLQPAANLDRLEYVLVVLDYQGGLPPADEQPVDCSGGKTLPAGEQPCAEPTPSPTATPHASASTKP